MIKHTGARNSAVKLRACVRASILGARAPISRVKFLRKTHEPLSHKLSRKKVGTFRKPINKTKGKLETY